MQYTGTLDLSVPAQVYDLDVDETSAATVAALHARGRKVICYVDAGSFEDFRSDASAYPASVLGSSNGWPGERWVDVRRWDVLGPILAARFDRCRQKGFDAVDPDNMDGYSNQTGFPLTAADQLTFNRKVAALAHARGMSVGLKNDLEQVAVLEPSFDFAVNEQCHEYDECDLLTPFVRAGKAVFNVEYELATSEFCAASARLGLSSIRKDLALDASLQAC